MPWDDDFDIGMTYDNYIKFLNVCEEQLDKSKYYVQTPKKEEDYYLSFSKIRDITTTLIEEGNKDIDIVRSVYVDVFFLW
ncbi:MAG: LicD family protein [Bacilli bacterium]|nr:MAG: LicD family protein [Bacilli bacterium]